MAVRNEEILSAMLDNEASELEIRRFLRESESDPELLKTWQRWSLGQAALHDERLQQDFSAQRLGEDFAAKVAASISAEATPVQSLRWQGLVQPLAKMSIAASVAVAFYLGMQVSLTSDQPAGSDAMPIANTQPQEETPATLSEVEAVPSQLASTPTTTVIDPEARKRLEDYINSVAIEAEEPVQLQQLQDSPLYRLVNEINQTDSPQR